VIHIGLVAGHLGLGGQEVAILDLLRRLDRSRFRPFVYSFRPGGLLPAVRTLGLDVVVGHDRPPEDQTWTEVDQAADRRFRRVLGRRLRDDAIDVCLVFAWPGAVAAAREAGVPAIIERVDGPGLARRLADKSSCRRLICESEAVRALLISQRELLRLAPERVRVIKNGIDLRRFDPARYDRRRCRRALGLADDDFTVGTVARLAPQKNLGHLLEAVRHLADDTFRRRGHLKALLVGPDDGDRAGLEAAARRLGLGDSVRFLGPREDVPEILSALDVFVLPSLYEGTSRAVLEAMAMALPVVVSELPALAELIDGNGYLVGVLDPYQTWLALDELCRDEALRRQLGARSRQLAEQYDVCEMVRGYEAVIVEALREARRAPCVGRRIGFVGNPRVPGELAALRSLVNRLRARRLDAEVIAAPRRPSAGEPVPILRPTLGWALRRVDPDLVVVRSSRLVPALATSLRGNELLFWPPSEDPRGEPARRAVELADRVVFSTATARRRCARRWPQWAWKFAALPLPLDARDIAMRLRRILAPPRPSPPDGRLVGP
jgi:glycosyltransferase involved in cell wall biosynthesis